MRRLFAKQKVETGETISSVKWAVFGLIVVMVTFSDGATTLPVSPATQPAVAAPAVQAGTVARRSRHRHAEASAVPMAPVGSVSIADQIAPLRTRSIFVKGNQTIAVNDGGGARPGPSGPMVGRPESSLVFNGVTIIDDEADALIEDLSSHNVSTVRPGDPIAGGKVSAITFDDLTYEVGGVAKHVEIGQNLDGNTATFDSSAAVPAQAAVPAASGSPGTVTVPTGPTAVAPSGASTEDIIARMKARHAAEQQAIGGK